MSRPIDIAPEETNYNPTDMAEYASVQCALEKEALEKKLLHDAVVKRLENHRKATQSEKKVITEAVDHVIKIMQRPPAKRRAYFRTEDIAREEFGANDDPEMFSDHIDKGEVDAISEAAA